MKDSAAQAYLQILQEQTDLEEGKLKQAAIALGAAGAIAAGSLYSHIKSTEKPSPELIQAVQKPTKHDPEYLKNVVLQKFKKVNPDKVDEIVNAAIKHADPVFPQAHHLLAIAGIESSFDQKAVSKLKKDPGIGLMQVRPGVWNIGKKELMSVEGAMRHGAHILKTYHGQFGGNIDRAIAAYNIGPKNEKLGKKRDDAAEYLAKFKSELSRYQD